MKLFGDAVRQLMEAKKVSGLKLAESIGITPTSVSRILTGQIRPRQNAFTRMCQTPCSTKAEQQKLVAAFAGTELMSEESDQTLPSSEKEILRLRTEQFIERKTQSIQFKRSVALECKSNIGRDLEKTEAICELLSKQLDAKVHLIVPYLDDLSVKGCIKITEVRNLTVFFRR